MEEGQKEGLWLDTHQTPSLTSFPSALLSHPSVSGLHVLYICTKCMSFIHGSYQIHCTHINAARPKLLQYVEFTPHVVPPFSAR